METAFYIVLYLKTPRGFEHFARYYIGNKSELARELFSKLKGTTEEPENCILQMDLMETQNDLPVNIKLIGCTLEEMGENCKVITKEAFKLLRWSQAGPVIFYDNADTRCNGRRPAAHDALYFQIVTMFKLLRD